MATFYDGCSEIWGGCPATKGLEHGLDTADFEPSGVTAGVTGAVPSSSHHAILAHETVLAISAESPTGESSLRCGINQPPRYSMQ